MNTAELDDRRAQALPKKIFTRSLSDIVGHGDPLLIYRRPLCWRDALDCDAQRRRWDDWTALLEPADRVFHDMPDGWEDEWCAVLDWFRWDYLRIVHRMKAPEPQMHAFDSLSRKDQDRVLRGAHAIWFGRWNTMRGRPWAIIRDARENAFCCHHIDFYRRRAGKPVFYSAPMPAERSLHRKPVETFAGFNGSLKLKGAMRVRGAA